MPVVQTGSTSTSTLTVQQLVDYARLFPWTTPALGIAGYADEPAVSFAQDIAQEIMSKSNPWKWNAAKVPVFQTQPYQQDYPTNISQNTLGWLQAAVIQDINSTSTPKAILPLTCVLALFPTFIANRPTKLAWVANAVAQTGVWPGANTVYKDPLVANGGGPGNNPLAAILDPNGNIEVVSTYGTTGASQPTWPAAGAAAGTATADGSVVWSLIDPNGVAFRLDFLATFNSVVWQIQALYQKKPPVIQNLSDTFAPIPDDLSYLVKQGFLAMCFKQVDSNKFVQEYAQWQANVQKALGSSDRELTEFGFYPATGIQGGGDTLGGIGGYGGYVGWPNWGA